MATATATATATRNATITNTYNYTHTMAPQKLLHRHVAPGHVQGVLVQPVAHVDWLAASLQQHLRLSERRCPRRGMQGRRAPRGRHLQNGGEPDQSPSLLLLVKFTMT